MNAFRLVLVGSSCLLTAVEAAAQRLNEVEPNDTPATAMAAPFGAQIDASLTPGDHDWYSFTVAATSSVKLFTSPLTPTAVDTVLLLWDATGSFLLFQNDDQRDVHSDITIELAPGSYLVQVHGFSAATAGAYSLDLARTDSIGFTASESPEPNNTTTTATPVGCGSQIDAALSSPIGTDADWYKLVLTAPRTGVVFAVLGNRAPQVSACNWQFRNNTGGLLQPTLLYGPNSGSGAVNKLVVRTCLPPQTYYFSLSQTLGAGNYRLECAVMPMDVGGVVNEAFLGPTAIVAGQTGVGTIATSTDTDVWGPLVVSAGYLMAQVRGNGGSPLTDSSLELLDGKQQPFRDGFGEPLPLVDSGNLLDGNLHARGTWRLDAMGIASVYLRVSAPGNTGGYRLEIGGCGPFSGPTWVDGAGKKEGFDNVTCLGSNGFRPTLTTDSIYEVPVLGSLFRRRVELALPNTPVALIQGLSDTMSGFGPLPLDLTMFGAPGCELLVDPLAMTGFVTDGVGTALFLQATPSTLSLSGAVIYEQVVTLDPAANAFGVAFSNSLEQRLGRRSW
jgi:hypothetical protein